MEPERVEPERVEPERRLPVDRDEPELRDAVLRERDEDDDAVVRLRDRDEEPRRRAVGRCDAGISDVATAFASCGISRSRKPAMRSGVRRSARRFRRSSSRAPCAP